MTANPLTSESREEERPAAAGPKDGSPIEALARGIDAKLREIERTLDLVGDTRRGELLAEVRRDFNQLEALLGHTDELSSLSAFLQRNVEREKAALARELHDQLGGILTPAKMDVSWLEARLANDPQYGDRMRRLNKLIDEAIDLKRRIIENLHPSLLDHLGLASAMGWYVDETCRKAGIEPHLDISKDLERMPADLEIACFRLVQEGLANVVKHSRARHVDVTLERTSKGLHMTISDDGVGIANLEEAKKMSHGLAGMSHRTRSVNGTFKVHSLPGKGTRLEMFVPLETPAQKPARGPA